MNINDIVTLADATRPNVFPIQIKIQWIWELESEFAEMMGIDTPPIPMAEPYPDLLVPAPKDEVYAWYLCAKIDYVQEEMDLYANDSVIANQMVSEVKAWWRRRNKPKATKYYRGVYR